MKEQEKIRRFLKNHPNRFKTFFDRPHWTRRRFIELVGTGVTASFLAQSARADGVSRAAVTPINKAKSVIFILLNGAASHTDTFDLKMSPDTPADLNPATINGISWPTGLMPLLAEKLPEMAIVRSMRAYALVHNLAQTWQQIGRNPAAALGDIAPNMGSIVALEKEKDRTPSQKFPTFLALSSPAAVGSGYLSAKYAPFKLNPASTGLPNTTNPDGQTRLNSRWALMHALDDNLRINSPYGTAMEDMNSFYQAAFDLSYNPVVDTAFRFSTADSARYGTTPFGNSCLVAKQVLAANQGTRFIQITLGGWDMHQNIYDRQANPRGNIYALTKTLDDGLAALLTDLKSSGLLNETLIVLAGEFGRTVGRLSAQRGRDHYLQQFCMFAGAGVRGGRTIGSTDSTGARTVEFGWSRGRDIRPEDIEATLYSALGIDWTYVNYNDPFKRGFEYVPGGEDDVYGPIHELWS